MMNRVLCNPLASDLSSALSDFEEKAGLKVHSAASSALKEYRTNANLVPSLTEHIGYLTGRLCVPSSPDDGVPEFVSIAYIVSGTQSLIVLTQDERKSTQENLYAELVRLADAATSTGQLILDLLQIVIAKVSQHIEAVELQLLEIQRDVRLSSTLKFEPAIALLVSCNGRTYPAEIEILSVGPVIAGLEEIGINLAQNSLDLIDSMGRELFGKDLEVSAREAALQCRNLRVMSDNTMRGLRSVFSEIERHQSAIQRNSSRLVASVVVLLFLPLLMLNFYSQFFAEGEIWSNSWTTDLFWIGIVIVEFGVLILLRARKWLGRRLP